MIWFIAYIEPVPHKRNHCSEKPAHHELWPTLTQTTEKPTHEDPTQPKINKIVLKKNAYLTKNLYSNCPGTLVQTSPFIIGKDWNRHLATEGILIINYPTETYSRYWWHACTAPFGRQSDSFFSVTTWDKHWILYMTSGRSQIS